MRRSVLVLFACLLPLNNGCSPSILSEGQTIPFSSIDATAPIDDADVAKQAQRDIEWLADPQREGRGPGTRGLVVSGDYIAGRMGAIGLKFVPGQSSYFQYFGYARVFSNLANSGRTGTPDGRFPARNVIAMLPGVGPHADEYVVVGAHYDHLGHGGYGSRAPGSHAIHPGADDNASGISAMLALAADLNRAGPQERSILFCAFTLEEEGTIGSANFVAHLPVGREKVVAMLNFDMVGRVKNHMLYEEGDGTHPLFAGLLKQADERSPLQLMSIGSGGIGPSDHRSFAAARIPSLLFYSGEHEDYHRPTDTADKINPAGVAEVVRLSFDLVESFCRMPKMPYVDKFDHDKVNVHLPPGTTSMPPQNDQ